MAASNKTTENKTEQAQSGPGMIVAIIIAWCWAVIPLAWGVTQTLHKAAALFNLQ